MTRLIIIFITIVLITGCTTKPQVEINYYVNSNQANMGNQRLDDIKREFAIADWTLQVQGQTLVISNNSQSHTITMPSDAQHIHSAHLSFDQRYLAFDIERMHGINVIVVDLVSGEYINISEDLGFLYNYWNYLGGYGLAWAPNKNVLVFIGVRGGDLPAAAVRMYYPGSQERPQLKTASREHTNLYGVKWDESGERIYFLVDTMEVGDDPYLLLRTEIEEIDGEYFPGDISRIGSLQADEFDLWFE